MSSTANLDAAIAEAQTLRATCVPRLAGFTDLSMHTMVGPTADVDAAKAHIGDRILFYTTRIAAIDRFLEHAKALQDNGYPVDDVVSLPASVVAVFTEERLENQAATAMIAALPEAQQIIVSAEPPIPEPPAPEPTP